MKTHPTHSLLNAERPFYRENRAVAVCEFLARRWRLEPAPGKALSPLFRRWVGCPCPCDLQSFSFTLSIGVIGDGRLGPIAECNCGGAAQNREARRAANYYDRWGELPEGEEDLS